MYSTVSPPQYSIGCTVQHSLVHMTRTGQYHLHSLVNLVQYGITCEDSITCTAQYHLYSTAQHDTHCKHMHVCTQVHGGVDLRLGNRSSPKHRRVPSEEALLKMAAQHNSPIPFPAVFSPIPEDYDSTVQQLQQQQQQQQQQQLQRPPSKTSQGTTFAERLNGFLTGAGGNSSKAAEPSSGLHQGALMSNIGSSPAQLSEVRHAQMAVSGSNAGYARDTSIAAVASAGGQSLESDFGLDRAGSGGTASTSGDPLDTAYSGLSGIHSARDKARNEAIAVYGERCELVLSELMLAVLGGLVLQQVVLLYVCC